MTGVIVDTCGWVAIVDARINIDLALEDKIGPVELKVTTSVLAELEALSQRESKTLLLDLLQSRAEIVSGEGEHTDDEILDLAISNSWPVLTVDKELKSRLHHANASVIEIHGFKALRLIE
ncbi:MAG: hypothetical protein VX320_01560 [Candidatus Thermoplasmatota archaeon]|nr:hypothetical protein [Candidatus Thermoplasmatota archaeon]